MHAPTRLLSYARKIATLKMPPYIVTSKRHVMKITKLRMILVIVGYRVVNACEEVDYEHK